jgi:hypothetical protein
MMASQVTWVRGLTWLRACSRAARCTAGSACSPDPPNDAAAATPLTLSLVPKVWRSAWLDDRRPPRANVTEMHASLFAIGDCFGVAGAEERARRARGRLRPILEDLANMTEGPRTLILRRPARAAAYLLTVTAQPREIAGEKDLSQELLEKLGHHPDPVTAKLSNWALSFRFAPDGTIRPFLAAAEHGKHDDDPY